MRRFVAERNWEPFHSPKNLSMGAAVEAAELMEHFLWVDNDASRQVVKDAVQMEQIADEMADVACYLLALANSLGISFGRDGAGHLDQPERLYAPYRVTAGGAGINAVFGDTAASVPVSSTKSMHGHLLGGAGALEFGAALLPLLRGWLPPTAFLEEPDAGCKLRHVPLRAERVAPPRAVMSNSFAFGGSNVVLIAERV